MTKICFEATYNLSTLHKMKTAELRDIWMRVCSPPTLKEQLIREILYFQKKNRSDELKLQKIGKTDSSSRSDERAKKLVASSSMPQLDHVVKSSDALKIKSATRSRNASKIQKMMKLSGRKSRISESRNISSRKDNWSADESDNESTTNKSPIGKPQWGKPHSYNSGLIRWIKGSEKVEKKSNQVFDHIDSKNQKRNEKIQRKSHGALFSNSSLSRKQRVKPRTFASVRRSNLQQRNKNNAEILDVDIQLDGLDSIPDIEKRRAIERESSTVFNIRLPSTRVRIDNFENIAE